MPDQQDQGGCAPPSLPNTKEHFDEVRLRWKLLELEELEEEVRELKFVNDKAEVLLELLKSERIFKLVGWSNEYLSPFDK